MNVPRRAQFFSRALGAAALTLLLLPARATAQITSTWTSSTGGIFSDAGNWNNGVPGVNDTAIFSLPFSYTVNVDGAPQIGGLLLDTTSGPANLNFNLTGSGLTMSGGATIGQSSGSNDNLTLSGAGSFDPFALQIATTPGTLNSPGAVGSLTVNGSMNVTIMAIGAGFGFGYSEIAGGQGTLTLNDGANLSAGSLLADAGGSGSALNFNGGTLTVGAISVNGARVALSAIGDGTHTAVLNLGGGTISNTPLRISQNATVNFNARGYTLDVEDIQRDTGGANPGTFNFVAGILKIPALAISPTGPVGASLDLTDQRSVNSIGTTVGTADPSSGTLSISGGELRTETLYTNAGGTTTFNRGSLTIANGDLAIGPGGINGGANIGGVTTTTLNQSSSFTVAGAITIASGYGLTIDAGGFTAHTLANNGGSATFVSGGLSVTGGDLHVGSSGFNAAPSAGAPTVTLRAGDAWGFYGNGTTFVDSGYSLTISGGVLSTGYLMTNGGTTTFTSGTLYINSGDLHIGPTGLNGVANFSLDSGSTFTVAGATIVDSGYSFSLNGGILQTGTFTNNGGAATFNSGRLIVNSGNVTVGNSADLNGSATTTLNSGSSISLNGATSINSSGSLIFNGGSLGTGTFVNNGGLATFNSGSLFVGGDLAIGNAGLNGGKSLGATTTIDSVSSIQVNGTTTIAAGFGLTIDGGRFTSNAISRDTTQGNPGEFTFSSGQLTVTSGNLDMGAGVHGVDNGTSPVTLASGSTIAAQGNSTIDAGKSLVVSGGGFQAVGLTVNGAGSLSGGSVYVSTLTTNPGGTFTYTGGALTIYGGGLNIGASGITNGSNGAIVSIPSGSSINSASGALSIDSGHELDIAGGQLYVNSINTSGPNGYGKFGYSGGYLEVENDNLSIGPTGQLNNTPNRTVAGGDTIYLRNGGIAIQAGQAVVVDGGRVTAQSIANDGGAFDYLHGALYLTANSSDVTIGSGLIRRGQGQSQQALSLSGGDVITINGSLTIDNSATIDGPSNSALQVGGNVLIQHGSALTGNLGISQGHGDGTMINHGIISPGSATAVGSMNIFAGDFIEAFDAELDFKLGGASLGQYDQLAIDAPLQLGGALHVSFMEGFTAQLGDTFNLIDPMSIDGRFDSLDLPPLPAGEQWSESIVNPHLGVFEYQLSVALMPVPEPSSWMLLAIGLSLFGAMVHRRGKRSSGAFVERIKGDELKGPASFV